MYVLPARTELLRAARHYAQQIPQLRADFVAEVRSVEERILQFPESAPRFRGDIRRALLHTFPYSVLYVIRAEDLVVVAVMHDRQYPDYWLARAGDYD